jgi:hypothetical protein
MRRTVVALCFISLAAPAVAALRAGPEIKSHKADAQHRSRRRPDSLSAETSANGIGWKQFVTASDGGPSWPRPASLPVAPELASWALMVGGIGLAGSLLRRGSTRKI